MQRERPGHRRRGDDDLPFDRVAAAKTRAKPRAAPRPRPEAVREAQAAGRQRFVDGHDVSRETLQRLDGYVALLTAWQARINLVAPATLGEAWERHVADSLYLERLLPTFSRSVDLGSGGGLPGLVIACARPDCVVDLVESNAKKAAFLRAVQRELGLQGMVHTARIEACGSVLAGAEIVTARALAPLTELLALVAPHLAPQARCFFQKGRGHEQEINAATAHWRFDMVKHASSLDDGSVVLEISAIEAVTA